MSDSNSYLYMDENHKDMTYIDSKGYVRFKDSDRYYHRWVKEKELGRYLEPWEVVHHKNKDRLDNRPENLEIKTKDEHYQIHVVARREALIIKAIFLGFAFFGLVLFISGLIIQRKIDMWYIGLLFLIMGLIGWYVQRRKA